MPFIISCEMGFLEYVMEAFFIFLLFHFKLLFLSWIVFRAHLSFAMSILFPFDNGLLKNVRQCVKFDKG
jgi:hypothetical protein